MERKEKDDFLLLSFSAVSPSNSPLQQNTSNQKLLVYVLETLKTNKDTLSPQIYFSPSMFFPFKSLSIPHWLRCFTSTAVISTAFTELINGAEGRVPLDWDNAFSLSVAHMDNCTEKRRELVQEKVEGLHKQDVYFFSA